jgi:nucleoprotein TPR
MTEVQERTKAAQEASQKLAASTRENELLNKQLKDLGRQVSTLLREIARRDDTTLPTDEEMDVDPSLKPAENTEELITNHLVLFRSVDQLQEQNQRLLKIVRELGEKLEREERSIREQCEAEQFEAVREAHDMIQELTQQLETQRASNAAVLGAKNQEVATLQEMLKKAGQAVPAVVEQPHINGETVPRTEIEQMKSHFEMYYTESAADTQRLRDELVSTQREMHRLESSLKKAEAQADVAKGLITVHLPPVECPELVAEHHRIMQEQLNRTKRELQDIEIRHQKLTLQYTRAETEYNNVADSLHEAKGENDRLRNECANLRAEKKIWSGVESRLVDENRQLALERSRLSDLMTNVQKMHNDLERSGESDRRRLEAQLELIQGQAYAFLLC